MQNLKKNTTPPILEILKYSLQFLTLEILKMIFPKREREREREGICIVKIILKIGGISENSWNIRDIPVILLFFTRLYVNYSHWAFTSWIQQRLNQVREHEISKVFRYFIAYKTMPIITVKLVFIIVVLLWLITRVEYILRSALFYHNYCIKVWYCKCKYAITSFIMG